MEAQEIQKVEKRPFQRPLLFESQTELEEKIESFFKECEEKKRVATITGLAVSLKTSRRTLLNYEQREEYFHTIAHAKQRIEAEVEQLLFSPYANGAKFNLVNNFGWFERIEYSQDGQSDKDKEVKSLVQNIFVMIQSGKNQELEAESDIKAVIDNIGQGETIDLKAISDGQ